MIFLYIPPRSLIEAQDEITDLKSKMRVLQHQFDQLKEEMVAKEAALARENSEQQRILKEKDDLQAAVDKSREETALAKQKGRETEKSLKMLVDKHRQLEADLEKARAKLDAALKERALLDAKLARRSEEMTLLERTVAAHESALARGETKFQERLEDLRVLKQEVRRLKKDETVANRNVQTLEVMRKEMLQLQRDLLRERTQVSALQAEVENPLNVHRWRRLEGTDPPTHELVQKVMALQKKLIATKEDITEKDLALQVPFQPVHVTPLFQFYSGEFLETLLLK
jgi:chromosome segregation ATPase